MRILAFAPVLFMPLLMAACTADDLPEQERAVAPVLTSDEAFDEFTYARPLEARVTHVALDLDLDFEGKRVEGVATLDVDAAEDASEIVLDSNGLMIGGITDGNGNELDYTIGESDPEKGEPITVQLGELTGPGLQQIVISYASGPDAEALQWLAPEQTGRRRISLCLQPGPGDPQPHVDPHAGQPRHPPDLGSAHHRAKAA